MRIVRAMNGNCERENRSGSKVALSVDEYTATNGNGPFLLLVEGDDRWHTAFIEGGMVRHDGPGSVIDPAGADVDSVSIRGKGFAVFDCHPERYRKGSLTLSKLTGRNDLMLWVDETDKNEKLVRHSLVPVKLKESSLTGLYDAVKEDGSVVPVCPRFDRYQAENGCGDYLYWCLRRGDGNTERFSLYILDKKYNSTVAGYSGGVSLVKKRGERRNF